MRLGSVWVGVALGLGVFVFAWRASPRPSGGPRSRGATRALAPAPWRLAAGPDSRLEIGTLRSRGLRLPVDGVSVDELRDSFLDARKGRLHEAIDIPARRGRRVVSVDDGTVAALLTGGNAGLAVYAYDPDRDYCYFYAHLDAFAPGLREDAALRKGDTIGFVGTTGNAPPHAPHLHFAVSRLGPDRRCRRGTAINPFAIFSSAPTARPGVPGAP